MAVTVPSLQEYLEKTATGSSMLQGLKDAIQSLWKRGPWGKALLLGGGALATAGTALGLRGVLGGQATSETMAYRTNRALNTLYDRIRADETAASSFAGSLGSEMAQELIKTTKDTIGKGVSSLRERLIDNPKRQALFNTLRREDPDLHAANPQQLIEAYNTMARVAPNLSTDKSAVRSFLRNAAFSGGGLDFNTIKGIADAEAAVSRTRE